MNPTTGPRCVYVTEEEESDDSSPRHSSEDDDLSLQSTAKGQEVSSEYWHILKLIRYMKVSACVHFGHLWWSL
jgi:hypothetical protein